MGTEKRIKWIDVAKALSLILVVLGHTLRTGLVRNIVYSFHVPCFFFLSGVVVDEEQSLKSVYKEARRILIPYYSFGIISIVIYVVLGSVAASRFGMSTDSVLENLGKLIYGFPQLSFNAPLWFLPALFATKIMYKLAYYLVQKSDCRLMCFAIVGSILSFYYTGLGLYALPFSFDLALKLFPFFIVGKLLAPILVDTGNIPQYKHKYLLFVGVLLLTICALGGENCPPVNYTNSQFPSPVLFYIVAMIGCLGIYGVSVYIQNCRWLCFLGRRALSILVMHKFPVVLFQIAGPFCELLQAPNSLKSFVLGGIPVTALAIVMSLIAGEIIEEYFPFLMGRRARTSERKSSNT